MFDRVECVVRGALGWFRACRRPLTSIRFAPSARALSTLSSGPFFFSSTSLQHHRVGHQRVIHIWLSRFLQPNCPGILA
eukprot:13692822-Heterocapsa_arctica.AAC.1